MLYSVSLEMAAVILGLLFIMYVLYFRFTPADGYVLLMGVGQEKNTYVHAVEEALGLPDRITEELWDTTLIDKEGNDLYETAIKEFRIE